MLTSFVFVLVLNTVNKGQEFDCTRNVANQHLLDLQLKKANPKSDRFLVTQASAPGKLSSWWTS